MRLSRGWVVEFPRMRKRAWILAACVLVIAAILLLAPAMVHLRFEPARPHYGASDTTNPPVFSMPHIDESISVWQILAFWLALVVPILLALLLLPPEIRKRLLQQVIRFALFMLALVLVLRYRLIHLPEIEAAPLDPAAAGFQTLGGTAESEVFTPPIVPPWMTYIVSLMLVALLALGVYVLYRAWMRTHNRRLTGLDAIASAARLSLDDLADGRQWGDVVVEAYARMTDAVRVARGMHREAAWTPREFADRLAHKGLPASAVNDLTGLFEAARYGGAIADERARLRAASCLQSILQACRTAA